MTQIEIITEEQRAQKHFEKFMLDQAKWKQKVTAIKVKTITDVEAMKAAKELRITLRDIRVGAEKLKKELKADALAYNKAIDFCYNSIANMTKPLEEELLAKEKYAENLEKERLDKVKVERLTRLAPFTTQDTDSEIANLAEMSEADFEDILAGRQSRYEIAQAEARLAEQQAQEAREAEAIEKAKLQAENLKLKEQVKKQSVNIEKQSVDNSRLNELVILLDFDSGKTNFNDGQLDHLKEICDQWITKLTAISGKLGRANESE